MCLHVGFKIDRKKRAVQASPQLTSGPAETRTLSLSLFCISLVGPFFINEKKKKLSVYYTCGTQLASDSHFVSLTFFYDKLYVVAYDKTKLPKKAKTRLKF